MKKLDIILYPSLLLGSYLIDKYADVGRGPFLVLLLSAISFLYLVIGWYLFGNDNHRRNSLVFSIPLSIIVIIFTIGIMFRLQAWPTFGMIETSIFSGMVLLGIIVFKYYNTKEIDWKGYYKYLGLKTLSVNLIGFILLLF